MRYSPGIFSTLAQRPQHTEGLSSMHAALSFGGETGRPQREAHCSVNVLGGHLWTRV